MLQSKRSTEVIRILGKLKKRGVPPVSKEGIEFETESMELGPDTIASPSSKPSLDQLLRKKKPSPDEEDESAY